MSVSKPGRMTQWQLQRSVKTVFSSFKKEIIIVEIAHMSLSLIVAKKKK